MGKLQEYVSSLEAIDFQYNALFFRELTAKIQAIRDSGDYSDEELKKSGIDALIKEHTGISCTVKVDKEFRGYNAYVYPPQLDKNHPLLNYWRRHVGGSADGLAAIKAAGKAVEGLVDLKRGRVAGVFANIPIRIYITIDLLRDSYNRFTASEVAAILLHEIGHVFTYFEFIVMTLTTNHALEAVSRALLSTHDKEYKVRIVKEASKQLNAPLDDPEALAESTNATVIHTVILESKLRGMRSSLGSDIYDQRSWEYLADQYATRHGAGRELATALDKISRIYGDPSVLPSTLHVIIEAYKVVVFIGMSLTLFLLPVVILLMINPLVGDYDRHGERLTRIRQQLVEALKNRRLSKIYRDQLLEDIKAIDQLLAKVKDKSTLLEAIWKYLVPAGRKQWKQTVIQKELEELAANDLFVAAARLQQINT